DKGYPIASFTWVIAYKEQRYNDRKEEEAKALVNLLWWMTHSGQKYAEPLKYAPIPSKAQKKAENVIRSITYNGKPVCRK
ncbi:MAG: phosphate ABC transporter substrate-binding protein PstS, partial [Candidatus Muiribacteriaceae bacterium]